MVRDYALAASGLLVGKIGGQPDFSALESALRGFVSDDSMRVRLAAHGYARIAESFDVVPLAARLRTRFAECGG